MWWCTSTRSDFLMTMVLLGMITATMMRRMVVHGWSSKIIRSAPLDRQTTHLVMRSSHLWSSSTSRTNSQDMVSLSNSAAPKPPVPVTLLSGFLGTGKTSALQHLLENKDQLRIGVVVNDVAAVNIDAKLIAAATGDITELQNGCACCSLADELYDTVERLLQGRDLDAVVVELSGVADPAAIQNNWKMAPATIRDIARLDRTVTLVDASTFGTDYMTWDVAGERPGWVAINEDTGEILDDCIANRKVTELLVEQVEAAQLILVNKVDLADPEQVEIARTVARALNDKAEIITVQFGKIDPKVILYGMNKARSTTDDIPAPVVASSCDDPTCTDPSHHHDHAHEHHGHAHHDHDATTIACLDPACTDPSHDHDHRHDHKDHAAHGGAAESCADPACTDPSHSHDRTHNHHQDATAATSCQDPTCNDPTHHHDHSHSHSHDTSLDQLGIVNFVYKRTKPFDASKLMALLYKWPVPIKNTLDVGYFQNPAQVGDGDDEDVEFKYSLGLSPGKKKKKSKSTQQNQQHTIRSPFVGVLRSKGFCWFSPQIWHDQGPLQGDAWRHDTAMYWSHAGKHFGITAAGKWWGTIPQDKMVKFFVDNMAEYERILKEDFVTVEYGDRRQELVFIGTKLQIDEITQALDACLLTDDEMERYRQDLRNFMDSIVMTTTAASTRGRASRGLFDVGGVDQVDIQ